MQITHIRSTSLCLEFYIKPTFCYCIQLFVTPSLWDHVKILRLKLKNQRLTSWKRQIVANLEQFSDCCQIKSMSKTGKISFFLTKIDKNMNKFQCSHRSLIFISTPSNCFYYKKVPLIVKDIYLFLYIFSYFYVF